MTLAARAAPAPGALLTGWVGRDPRTGQDAPFLLLHAAAGGGEDRMLQLVGLLGMELGEVTDAPPQLRARIHDHPGRVRVELGAEPIAGCPVSPDWRRAARDYGAVAMGVSVEPITVRSLGRAPQRLATMPTALALLPLAAA